MSKREIDAVASVLTDPENGDRTAEEVAELAIAALDDVRARSHRMLVVGQIRFQAQEATHTVALGPFTSRGILDSREKFSRAVQGSTAARTVGQQLAWDVKTGTGTGRFMLVPAFMRPRDAWDFFRPEKADEEAKQLTSKMLLEGGWREAKGAAELKADLDAWSAGLWAEQCPPTPACTHGLKHKPRCHRHEAA